MFFGFGKICELLSAKSTLTFVAISKKPDQSPRGWPVRCQENMPADFQTTGMRDRKY